MSAHHGSCSHQSHQTTHWSNQIVPEITMQIALQKPAFSASRSPSRWMPSVPTE
jgi:hypothetical protein